MKLYKVNQQVAVCVPVRVHFKEVMLREERKTQFPAIVSDVDNKDILRGTALSVRTI